MLEQLLDLGKDHQSVASSNIFVVTSCPSLLRLSFSPYPAHISSNPISFLVYLQCMLVFPLFQDLPRARRVAHLFFLTLFPLPIPSPYSPRNPGVRGSRLCVTLFRALLEEVLRLLFLGICACKDDSNEPDPGLGVGVFLTDITLAPGACGQGHAAMELLYLPFPWHLLRSAHGLTISFKASHR